MTRDDRRGRWGSAECRGERLATRPTAGDPDRGSATIFICIALAALLAVMMLGIHFGAVVLARHRAESAADLAALAGAAAVLQGDGVACDRALELTAANGAALETCEVIDLDIRVTATLSVAIGPFQGTATGRARAGPDEEALG